MVLRCTQVISQKYNNFLDGYKNSTANTGLAVSLMRMNNAGFPRIRMMIAF